MNDKHRRNRERGQRVRLNMSANERDFPQGSKALTLASSLEGMLADADALDAARSASARKRKQGTEARDGARTKLRRMVRITYDTAEPLGLDHPEIKGVFKPPSKNNNDQELAAAARSATTAAAQFAALFTESGLPPVFFDEMRTTADRLDIAAATQAEAAGELVAANAALEDIFRRMEELIDRLDPIVRNSYANDPAKLAAWESARRLERAPHRKPDDDEDDDEDDNAPPPPAPANP